MSELYYRYIKNSPINLNDLTRLGGTSICKYYTKRYQQTGDFYYCSIALTMCNLFPKKPNTWLDCIRCLNEYDVICNRCDSETGRIVCAVFAYANCLVMCILNPDDLYETENKK